MKWLRNRSQSGMSAVAQSLTSTRWGLNGATKINRKKWQAAQGSEIRPLKVSRKESQSTIARWVPHTITRGRQICIMALTGNRLYRPSTLKPNKSICKPWLQASYNRIPSLALCEPHTSTPTRKIKMFLPPLRLSTQGSTWMKPITMKT